MTGPEHYREAERWLEHAKGTYLDTSQDPGPRENYATEAEWMDALRESAEHHELALREASVFAALGQAHATLALAAATALIDETPRSDSFDNYRAWERVAGSSADPHTSWCQTTEGGSCTCDAGGTA